MLDENPNVLARAGQLLGLIAGGVGALYVTGGLLLLTRFWVHGFEPPLDVVTRLPRELLISTALLGIAVPVFVLSITYLVARSLSGRTTPPRVHKEERFRLSLAWAIFVLLVSIAWGMTKSIGLGPLLIVGSVIACLGFMLSSLALQGRNALIVRAKRPHDWGEPGLTGAAAILIGLIAIPFGLVLQAFAPLQAAKVCTDRDAVVGTLLADAPDRTYLGESAPGRPFESLVAISGDDVRRVLITPQGPDARSTLDNARCVTPPPRRVSASHRIP
jgi:hypothetical protein